MWQKVLEIVDSRTDKPVFAGSTWAELGFDSLEYLELVGEVEKTLNVEIDDKAMAEFRTPGEMIAWMEAHC